ncbi:unnamed protein product [Effrenium voratum]|nr:unnamed protein product [Effrenium voratum]
MLRLSAICLLLSIFRADASRGEASLQEAQLSASGVAQKCESAVDNTRTASETIKALQTCIGMLERFNKEGSEARLASKRSGKQYASDMNLLGSFLQSLEGKVSEAYRNHQQQYDGLRDEQHQAFSGFLEQLQTIKKDHSKVEKRLAKHGHHVHHSGSKQSKAKQLKHAMTLSRGASHQASSVQLSSKRLKTLLHKVRRRKQRHMKQAPSLLQLSEADAAYQEQQDEMSKVGEDLQKLQENMEIKQEIADQEEKEARDAEAALARISRPSSLLQLEATQASKQDKDAKADAKDAKAPSSLLEQEVSSIANLIWKPWKPGQALNHMVGIGFTKDDKEAEAVPPR